MDLGIGADTRVVVQGMTGRQGSFHTKAMLEYGTNIVAGVTPGKGGGYVADIPVYDSIGEVDGGVDASILFVPPRFTKDAVLEALEHSLNPIVVVTEGVPVFDSMGFVNKARGKNIMVVGPNTPGLIRPGHIKLGIMPNKIFTPGNVAVVSRSGTLTYEVVAQLTARGVGQSMAVGLGGDPVVGLGYIDLLEMLKKDEDTESVVLIGEIGGEAEEKAARYLKETEYPKPVYAYIVGKSAPEGKRMGHAGAIVSGGSGTYDSKIKSLSCANVDVAESPSHLVDLITGE